MNIKGLKKGWVILRELEKELGIDKPNNRRRIEKYGLNIHCNKLMDILIIVEEKPFLTALVNSYQKGKAKAELMAKIDKYMEGKNA